MRIVFDPATLHQSRMGAITGDVHFDFGPERTFPSAGWSDFVVVVGSWWLAAVEEVAQERSEKELFFMDGPYWIKLVPQGGAPTVLLQCIEDREGVHVVDERTIELDELHAEIKRFAANVSRACAKARIESDDLEILRSLLSN